MSEKNRDGIITWAYWIYILVCTIGVLCKEIPNVLINLIIEDVSWWMMVLGLIGMFVMLFVLQIVSNYFITIAFVAYKIVNRKHKKSRIEKVDLKNDNYYREIIPRFSPAVLSYLDDFEVNKNDIIATLMSLELKNKIVTENNTIEIINLEINDLSENEKYVFECLKKKDRAKINLEEFKRKVIEDASKEKLVESQIDLVSKLKRVLFMVFGLPIIALIVFFIIFAIIPEGEISGALGAVAIVSVIAFIICFILAPIYAIMSFSAYASIKVKDPYVRTKRGKELNEQLEGLRKYLNDYSTIKDRTKEELKIWEDYLIYSVIFGMNKEIVEGVSLMIEVE